MERRRVAITGMGVITPAGLSLEEFWSNCLGGRSCIARITHFDPTNFAVQIAGEAKGFNPENYMDRIEARKLDRFVQLAIVAAEAAARDAALSSDKEDPSRIGVVIGSGVGGIGTLEAQHTNLMTKGPARVSPYFVPMMIVDMASGMVSMRGGFKGPNFATVSACASSAHALGEAFRILQHGDADVMLAGGAEASVTPMTVAGFASMKALSRRNDEPARASRPFDKDRDGFVLGEGAGVLVLETLDHAKARGARIYAELAGYGMSADAHHMTAPDPQGEGAAMAMRLALKDAGLRPADVSLINAHGTSTPYNDQIETVAIKAVFGEHAYHVPVNSTKSIVGHLLGAGGAVELIGCVLSIRDGRVHPTINYENPDPDCDLDYVPNEARAMTVRSVLSNSFGFGGHNVSLVVRAYEER
ncbi:MAG TPA: beta-ketoacyl-ACP synthase II [bacterium]|nr:beta-ketoacyl-ACP synthase II [bacterium]